MDNKKKNVESLKRDCTGCGACAVVCKQNAITYDLDVNGFYSVKVARNLCVECGKCLTVCGKNIADENLSNISNKKTYAACSKEKNILECSTSGGIAYEIAKMYLTQDGVIFGTAFDLHENVCKIIKVSNENELRKLQGSKYIQSNTVHGFKEVVAIAKRNPTQKILVFGTPCQIYGINKVLEMERVRDRCVCVEVFCHGVPSKLLWDKYLEETKKKNHMNTDVSEVSFRSKKYGWHMYTMKLATKDKSYYVTSEASDFYRVYFEHAALNKSCIACRFREGYSAADIRLGDFWGNNFIKNEEGVSAVIPLTEQGKYVWDRLKKNVDLLGEYDSESCIKYQSIKKYEIDRKLIDEVLELLKSEMSLGEIIKRYRKQFDFKARLRLFEKDMLSLFPAKYKMILKRAYNFTRNKFKG